MSTFKVEVVRLDNVMKHPGADSLDLIHFRGWQVVSRIGNFKTGDLAIYIPLDAILPENLKEKYDLPSDHKRMKTMKLRGELSQGMLVKPEPHHKEGDDVTAELGITKYEPPPEFIPANMRGNQRKASRAFDHLFVKYTGIENFKNYPKMIQVGEEVVITEKLHGSNFRAMHLGKPDVWTRIKRYFGKGTDKDDLYVGSHNINLHYRKGNAYWDCAVELDLHKKLAAYPKYIVFGEVFGSTQKGFNYGVGVGNNAVRVFDIYHDGKYLDYDEMVTFCTRLDLPVVPLLYRGPWSEDIRKQFVGGKTTLGGGNIREGIVVKPVKERRERNGRVIVKCISDDYLIAQGKKKDEDATEFH